MPGNSSKGFRSTSKAIPRATMQGKAATTSKSQEPGAAGRHRKPTLNENIILGQSSEENYSMNEFGDGSVEDARKKGNPF